MRARAAPARAPFPHASARTPNRPPPHGHGCVAAARARARARFNSRPRLWVVAFAPVAAPQPRPRAPATAPLASVDAAWGRGRAAPGGRQTRQWRQAAARHRGGRVADRVGCAGETPWRATAAASLPPAPTATPRDPNLARPVRRLAVGLVAPLITLTPTLSPRCPSLFRSGGAHRHDSDDMGASVRCAFFALPVGEGARAPPSGRRTHSTLRLLPRPHTACLGLLVAASAVPVAGVRSKREGAIARTCFDANGSVGEGRPLFPVEWALLGACAISGQNRAKKKGWSVGASVFGRCRACTLPTRPPPALPPFPPAARPQRHRR